MSSLLFRHFYDGDVDKFRAVLAPPGYNGQSNIAAGGGGVGSSGAFGTSPKAVTKSRKSSGWNPGYGGGKHGSGLGKNEVNARDHTGLTILLRAASSTAENAIEFVRALLQHPAIDLYAQDWESGWNCLHRALYAGNISIARLLLEKERENLTSHTVGASVGKIGHLIKTKDHEGKAPFDLFNSTIGERDLSSDDKSDHDEDGSEYDYAPARDAAASFVGGLQDIIDGDELFAFGSNKNLSLGLGDQDDRQFPERVSLKRPDHLLQRFYAEYMEKEGLSGPSSVEISKIPALVLSRPLIIHDVVLSKLHSAVLTNDPVSNLYVCGVGRGGRLGLGDENTRFNYAPVQGGLADRKVHKVALGQNHSMALTDNGELWTWGSNAESQLGYSLPPPARPDEEPMSTVPRQVFGSLKKEVVLGIAASAIHSVAHTGQSLFCWGKNAGQLALMDADSRSLEVQQTPRKVAASIFASPIVMVSAIDKATTCLLANHTVICFTAYGYNIVKFPFAEMFSNYHLTRSSMSSRYEAVRNQIQYITSGGDTIAAVTGRGDLFTFGLNHKADSNGTAASTTNPSKIKGAVTTPHLMWNARQEGVRSVGVGEHGSVIICTESGAVWRRVKRAKAKDAYVTGSSETKRKDFKFQRVPYITKIVSVRASPFGAFAAIRKDIDVMQKQVHVGKQTLWDDIRPLNPLSDFRSSAPPPKEAKQWADPLFKDRMHPVAWEVLKSPDIEGDLKQYLETWSYRNEPLDMAIRSSSWPDLVVPVHGWLLCGRIPSMLRAITGYREGSPLSERDAQYFQIEEIGDTTVITFQGLDVISILNVVQFLYEDAVIAAWNCIRQRQSWAFRYRQIRTELQKLTTALDMPVLEAAVRLQVDPQKAMANDFKHAVKDSRFFEDGDTLLELDGAEVQVHSTLITQRCPWFQALFHGRSGGRWLAGRRETLEEDELLRVDLKHIHPDTFTYVLQHIYSDAGEELFESVVTPTLEDFEDLVMDVMSVANELMLDRLSQICQKIMGKFVNTRNISSLLNEISPCAVTEFKDAGLEYICLQVETMLENHLLDDLEEDLLLDLDEVVRENQLAQFPFVRSGRAELLLHEQNPELAGDIDEERQRRVKEIAFKATQREEERKMSASVKPRYGSLDESNFPTPDRVRSISKAARNEPLSPDLKPKQSQSDLMFDMDDDETPAVSKFGSKLRKAGTPVPDIDELPTPTETSMLVSGSLSASGPRTPAPNRTIPVLPGQSPGLSGGSPWKAAPLPTAKLDLKEVFKPDFIPNQSALSAGLTSQKGKEATRQAQAKISQKERKKQQQAQAAQAALLAAAGQSKGPAWDKSSEQSAPWKVAGPKGKAPAPASPAGSLTPVTPIPKPLLAAEASSSKSLPRRTASPDTRFSGQSRTPNNTTPIPTSAKQKQPSRRGTPVNPTTSTTPVPRPSASSTPVATKPAEPLIPHSKSYLPPQPKAEPMLGLSIADIMSQELAEQVSAQDAVAKRSLQEIQEEQAFQEWWDAESRRTQEEEARRTGRAGGGSKSGTKDDGGAGGKRGGRISNPRGGRGGKRGGKVDVAGGPASAPTQPAGSAAGRNAQQQPGQGATRGVRRRGRGGGTGVSVPVGNGTA